MRGLMETCSPSQHLVRRLTLRNYKSVERCDIELSDVTILAGRNGAGKSNIIDSLHFIKDSLRDTLEYAVRKRGGIAQVRRKSSSKPTFPGMGIELSLPDNSVARYSFRIAAVRDPKFRVDREECSIFDANSQETHSFKVLDGDVVQWSSSAPTPPVSDDRLYLVAASGLPEFRRIYDILTRMVFHNLNPEAMKKPQSPEPGALLSHDGSNIASVVKQLESAAPKRLERVLEYLRAIGVPLNKVKHKQSGSLETLEVLQDRGSGNRPASFDAIALSDGTIRALGILLSLVSVGDDGDPGPSLIGIEEPETALHPAAAGALMEALAEGSESTQLLVTCHSPDLLDHPAVAARMIRPVILEDGRTRVGVLSEAKSTLLAEHLSTAGELLRLDQLDPDRNDLDRQDVGQGMLFDVLQ
jgi:predicted ATPase